MESVSCGAWRSLQRSQAFRTLKREVSFPSHTNTGSSSGATSLSWKSHKGKALSYCRRPFILAGRMVKKGLTGSFFPPAYEWVKLLVQPHPCKECFIISIICIQTSSTFSLYSDQPVAAMHITCMNLFNVCQLG